MHEGEACICHYPVGLEVINYVLSEPSTSFLFVLYVSSKGSTVVPTKSNSDVMFCLQRYQGRRIDRSLVY